MSLASEYTDSVSATFTTNLIAPVCDETNNPPVDLGEIDISAGSALTSQGSVPATVAGASCVDSDSRSGVYLRFTVAAGEAGAVKVEAPRGTSTMSPELLLRSGTAYTGAALFQDIRASVEDAWPRGWWTPGPTPCNCGPEPAYPIRRSRPEALTR